MGQPAYYQEGRFMSFDLVVPKVSTVNLSKNP